MAQIQMKQTPRRKTDNTTATASTNDRNKQHNTINVFRTVKVDGAVIGQRQDVKSVVIRNTTTSSDLLSTALGTFSALYEDRDLFYLTVDTHASGTDDKPRDKVKRVLRLRGDEVVPEILDRYPSGEHRFVLHVKPEARIVTVYNTAIKPQKLPCSVFITGSATCRHLVQLMLNAYKVHASPEQYTVYGVDSASEIRHELDLSDKLLSIPRYWLDPHECYFEVRKKRDTEHKTIRRSRSLEEVGTLKTPFNISQIRKILTQKQTPLVKVTPVRRTAPSGQQTSAHHMTMARVRAFLSSQRNNASVGKMEQHTTAATTDGQAGSNTLRSRVSSKDMVKKSMLHKGQGSVAIKRGSRSLSRERSGDGGSKSGYVFGQHTLERSIQRQRKRSLSEEDTVNSSVKGRRDSAQRSASLDRLTAWERRKLYDVSRRLTESGRDVALSGGETERKTPEPAPPPPSQQQQQQQRQLTAASKTTAKTNVSAVVGKTRSRRWLPQLPRRSGSDVTVDRKRRISELSAEKSELFCDCGQKADDLNVESIEESAHWPEDVTSDEVTGHVVSQKVTLFEPVDPPIKLFSPTFLERKLRPGSDQGHQADQPQTGSGVTTVERETVNGVEIAKPVPKLPTGSAEKSPVNKAEVVGVDKTERPKPLSLHEILKSHDLHRVTLRPICQSKRVPEALKFVLATFEHSNNRWPRGKIPLLGQNGSAFVAVSQLNASELCMTSSLLAIDDVDRGMLTETDGRLAVGDFVIELNGTNMLNVTLPRAVTMVTEIEGQIDIVVAREKQNPSDTVMFSSDLAALRQSRDRYASLVDELRMELQSRDNTIHGLELDLSVYKQQISELNNNIRRKASPETNQRQRKIAQLRELLSHSNDGHNCTQNEGYHVIDYDYDGMHVSAV